MSTGANRTGGTVWTLFGNDAAARNQGSSYAAGATLALVTWIAKDDPHWFGARIPGSPVSVEVVSFNPGNAGLSSTGVSSSGVSTADAAPMPTYELYTGSPLRPQPASRVQDRERIQAILGVQPPVLP